MRQRTKATIHDLRVAIDCLPRHTRIAMLRGIQSGPIIVGAYTGEDGICPMLAAHRNGGRTSFIAFARAWDSFAYRGQKGRCSRRATPRELLVLRSHLEASLLADETPAEDLAAVIAEHRAAVQARRPRPGDVDRSRELRHRRGWRWTRPARSLEEYERLLAALEQELGTSPDAGSARERVLGGV
jgi:hypothetical protein